MSSNQLQLQNEKTFYEFFDLDRTGFELEIPDQKIKIQLQN